jgi:hypothetical protein
VQLEFRSLSHFSGLQTNKTLFLWRSTPCAANANLKLNRLCTGDDSYARMGDKSFYALDECAGKKYPGLYPMYLRNDACKFTSGDILEQHYFITCTSIFLTRVECAHV